MEAYKKQCLLAYMGYYPYKEVDNQWGEQSQRATEAFQRDYQLTADRIFGDGTLGRALEVVASGEESIIEQERENAAQIPEAPGDAPTDDDALFWDSIPNFDKEEFDCHCGCGLNIVNHDLVCGCQQLRDTFDAAFIITSPCRCPANNARWGGVANSKHLTGEAVDFRIRGKTAAQVLPFAQGLPYIRYAYCIDNDHVHMEMY